MIIIENQTILGAIWFIIFIFGIAILFSSATKGKLDALLLASGMFLIATGAIGLAIVIGM